MDGIAESSKPPSATPVRPRRERLLAAGVVAAALAVAIFSQWPALTDRYHLNNDVRQHVYWMQQWQDPALFRHDLLTEYARDFQPWGFRLLYRVLAPVVPPLLLSRFLPLLLLALAALYTWRLGRLVAGELAGLLAVAMLLVAPTVLQKMAGGMPRGFALPLLAMFLFYLARRAPGKSFAVLLAQALFYPMVFLASVAAAALFLALPAPAPAVGDGTAPAAREGRGAPLHRLVARLRQPMARAVLLATLAGGGLLFVQHVLLADPALGPTATRADMVGRPEYSPLGRWPALPTPPLGGLAAEAAKGAFFLPASAARVEPWVVAALCAVFAWEAARGRVRHAGELACLAAGSVAMYFLAMLLLIRLFHPERYVQFSFRLLVVVVSAAAIARLVERLRPRPLRLAVAAAVLALVLSQAGGVYAAGVDDYSAHAPLYAWLRTLPADALIAAPPYLADNIPTFAGRKVLVDFELSHAYELGYWHVIERRTYDLFDAYYAADLTRVGELLDRYGIDYLVVDRELYAPDYLARGRFYFEPFNSYVARLVAGRRDFALARVAAERALFRDGEVFVLDRRSLLNPG